MGIFEEVSSFAFGFGGQGGHPGEMGKQRHFTGQAASLRELNNTLFYIITDFLEGFSELRNFIFTGIKYRFSINIRIVMG